MPFAAVHCMALGLMINVYNKDMKLRLFVVSVLGSLFILPLAAAASMGLSASCAGAPSASTIVWSASSTGGVVPIAFLWGNGSTSTSQTVAGAPGTYTTTLQVTDASSTIATTTCSATIALPTTSGPSVADQIAALLNQIAALKAQITQLLLLQTTGGSGAATSTPGCFNFDRDLQEGDKGDDVKDLQATLASDPSIFPSSLVTGFFGHMTKDGIKKFQKQHGIHSTGFFGPMSRSFFHDQCSTGDSDHDGVPNSIDDEDGDNNDVDNGDHSATSTVSREHEGTHQQNDGDHGGKSHDD